MDSMRAALSCLHGELSHNSIISCCVVADTDPVTELTDCLRWRWVEYADTSVSDRHVQVDILNSVVQTSGKVIHINQVQLVCVFCT